jgi:phage/plasmid-like protein (TIGR03299 family)
MPSEMRYGENPWESLGKRLNRPLTSAEAIVESGLNWPVEFDTLKTVTGGIDVPERYAIVRKDNNAILGIVTHKYKLVQNFEAFSFFDNVVGQDSAIYHTAGCLGLGERVWIMAKMPNNIIIKRVDEIEKFLLFSHGHDGKISIHMFYTPIRVIGQNTLNIALKRGEEEGITIRHLGDIQEKIAAARNALGIAQHHYNDFEERAKYLASVNADSQMVENFLVHCFNGNGYDVESKKVKNMVDKVKENFEAENRVTPQIAGTAWALFNAYITWVDHQRATKGPNELARRSNHLSSIWFKQGAKFKQHAWKFLIPQH